MNLFETVKNIGEVAKAQPNINSVFYGSVYQLNDMQDIKYGACVITQREHTEEEDRRTYGFYIFLVDRLLNDKSNALEVQSYALDTLSNIFASLREEYDFEVDNITYTTFEERFDSECAGAYATVNLSTDFTNYCNEDYD